MAVDTQDKRASVIGLGLAALLVLPAPGAIDQPDRQQVAYSYRGIQADVAGDAVFLVGARICVPADDRAVLVEAEDRTVSIAAEDRTVLVEAPPSCQ